MEPIVQITSYRPADAVPRSFPGKHPHRATRVADDFLLLALWTLLSLTCCAAAMAVADVL
ncbi:hypothetical protein [Cupriavidus sp. AcVe19-1a]|uniref:hypothetical protein n=1 Tax=Cupriavidus sp. AcVe19-1a TaxID=2821359 RepID=UPI00048A7939|nr:hypothetical protein [Cupriavidus sp. AcVe19-1a]MBP0627612.1 hypothetical protein [Cupriavidus sp. AcVe19-1a]